MPSGYIPYSLSYLLLDTAGRVHVVDPGWSSETNWTVLVETLTRAGRSLADVTTIVATHLHPDHLGMAGRLRTATGAQLVMHAVEQSAVATEGSTSQSPETTAARLRGWQIPEERLSEFDWASMQGPAEQRPTADVTVVDGDRLLVPGFDLEVIWTPGHTSGHLCLVDVGRNMILTGDHLIPTIHACLGLGAPSETNPLADYVASLEKLAVYGQCEVLPGHGYRFLGLTERSGQSREHHLRRAREVALVLAAGSADSVYDTAAQLTWSNGWQNLHGFYLYSALLQTAMHVTYVEQYGAPALP